MEKMNSHALPGAVGTTRGGIDGHAPRGALTRCAIEGDSYPFEFLSVLAGRESWRKEINRPIYHIHKWWAKRLGSVFRGILLGGVMPDGADIQEAFYQAHDFANVRVLDPFMGSGTTIGEAAKLGMAALGRDINPVAYRAVRTALAPLNRRTLCDHFEVLSTTVGERLLGLYSATDNDGNPCQVLYFFWVKVVPCPECSTQTALRSSFVFARNAYPGKKPEVQLCCPECGGVFAGRFGNREATCPECKTRFDQEAGPAQGTTATCRSCAHSFNIASAIRDIGQPPEHHLYAKLILGPDGKKQYLAATPADRAAYADCAVRLEQELETRQITLPAARLSDGYNTRQALAYNYKEWRAFFNPRQLLGLGWLHGAIGTLPSGNEREALYVLFSGVLEFNNLFASYKGEGTGAVRHMFSHHVLKPERCPIEANIWGTPQSSGAFSGLFRSRLLRALDYREAPTEVTIPGVDKRRGGSRPIGIKALADWPEGATPTAGEVAVSCGDSEGLGLPSGSVDLVVTDPPFFDNVHYSELADFFYAWQVLEPAPNGAHSTEATTRRSGEVQDGDAGRFAAKLRGVFAESVRVLKEEGLLIFTYHHSRPEGWSALASAVWGAGLSFVAAHPIRAEMAGATPKRQARHPILYDAVLVCRKAHLDLRDSQEVGEAIRAAKERAALQASRLIAAGLDFSRGDASVIVNAQLLVALGPRRCAPELSESLTSIQAEVERVAGGLMLACSQQPVANGTTPSAMDPQAALLL